MNKLILTLFLLACVGYAVAGYGSGTPGYYDPWTWYGGYDRYYYNNNRRSQPRPYYRDNYGYGGGYRDYGYGGYRDGYNPISSRQSSQSEYPKPW